MNIRAKHSRFMLAQSLARPRFLRHFIRWFFDTKNQNTSVPITAQNLYPSCSKHDSNVSALNPFTSIRGRHGRVGITNDLTARYATKSSMPTGSKPPIKHKQPSIEDLALAVPPWRSRLDICSLFSNCFDPVPDGFSDERWTIVRPDIVWQASQDEQVCQRVDDLSWVKLSFHPDCQAFSAVFIQDVQCPKGFAIVSPVIHKVKSPGFSCWQCDTAQFNNSFLRRYNTLLLILFLLPLGRQHRRFFLIASTGLKLTQTP